MQQAIYNTTNTNTISAAQTSTQTITTPARTLRHLARKWDLYAAAALMATCTAYGAFALAHVA